MTNKRAAEMLADSFGIGLERARQTLKAITQRGTRSALLPIVKRYRADRQFGVKRLNDKFATDTIWAKIRNLSYDSKLSLCDRAIGWIGSSEPNQSDESD